MKRVLATILLLTAALPLFPDEPVDQAAIAKIKEEAFQNSKVMDTISWLTDVHGPRLSGSPNMKKAADWAAARFRESGVASARVEVWGTFGPGWSFRRYAIEMVEPSFMPVIGYPKAWTPATPGRISGEPMLVKIASKDDFEKYRGKLKGAILLNGSVTGPNLHWEADAKRVTDADIEKRSPIEPGAPGIGREAEEAFARNRQTLADIAKFYKDEGVAAVLEPSERDHGVIRVGRLSRSLNPADHVPAFVIAREHFGRMQRLIEKKVPVRVELELQIETHTDTNGYNVIAEIPGSDPKLRDEVVMLGAHLDSWHAGTGAADNAAGSAAVIEAMRILAATGLKPRRTIRAALWGEEEQGHLGSRAYVKANFADPESGKKLPAYDKLAAYFNLDNGGGKIRGVHLQGNEQVRPIFEAWLAPFGYLGAKYLTIENTTGTDHLSFQRVGLPGFQFVQDPLEYWTRTHHTNMDVYEALVPDDMKQASAILANFVWHAANRNEKLPRREWKPAATSPVAPAGGAPRAR